MSPSKRILINTIASYGRSIVGVACGIFTTRWVLEALGHEDFGLYGLVGSLAIFLSFLSIQFSLAISRYYAFAQGVATAAVDRNNALLECRVWFSIALIVHLVLPVVICSVGLPVGLYAIRNEYLMIPVDKVPHCTWLWCFVCISCFVGMLSVPFHAMYTAKQYIAELTIYSLTQTMARTIFIYYMVKHPGEWLVRYGLGMLLISIAPSVILAIRAVIIFEECRFVRKALVELRRIFALANYALWSAIGGIGFLAGHQIMAIILNKAYGPRYNASFGISQTVAGEAASLTGALQNAFAPAVTTACGAGNLDLMRSMAFRVCKIGTLLTMMFAIPMALEIDELLRLWLKNPPPCAAGMCVCTLAFIVIEKMSCGHGMAVNAMGKVSRYQCLHGLLRLTAIPLALVPVYLQMGAGVTTVALPISILIVVVGDVYLARGLAGMSGWVWLRTVLLPLAFVSVVGVAIGSVPKFFMSQSFLRMVLTSLLVLVTLIPFSWFVILSKAEQALIVDKIWKRFVRKCR